jgi:hypothetical protein
MPMSADPEQQRIAQEQEAARTSHLFATTNLGQSTSAVAPGCQRAARQPSTPTGGGSDPI